MSRQDEYAKCYSCKASKPPEAFYKDASKPRGISTRCKQCEGKRHVRSRARYKGIRAIVDRAKAKPCADCGQTYPTYVMDMDHRPGAEKLFELGNTWGRTAVEVLDEIEKCDAVCANCHRERTHLRSAEK